MTPDLDNPLWQLLLIAALLWIAVALLCRHDRLKHRGALRARSRVLAHLGAPFARAARALAARLDHGLHRDRRRRARDERRAEHHRVGDAGQRLALTDDEVVALARHFHRAGLARRSQEWTDQALVIGLDKIEHAASGIVNAERMGRRPDVSSVMRRMTDR